MLKKLIIRLRAFYCPPMQIFFSRSQPTRIYHDPRLSKIRKIARNKKGLRTGVKNK